MANKKRSAPASATGRKELPQRKRQAISLASSTSRPTSSTAAATIKRSNRPRFNDDQDDDDDDEDEEEASDKDEEQDSETVLRLQLEAALRQHQLQFLQDSNLAPSSSTTTTVASSHQRQDKGKGKGKEVVKSVWDLGIDDLQDEEEQEESESEPDERQQIEALPTKRVAQVVAFSEPGRSLSSSSSGLAGTATVGLTAKELRDFKSGKIKSNILAKPSVADEANQKYRGNKGGKNTKLVGTEPSTRVKDTPEDAAEETHLSQLDSHLSSLTRSLHSNTSSLPDLLRELPSSAAAAATAASKPLKGHTPLPKNAPRSLRSGLNAANLRRAQARDAANGILAGSKQSSGVGLLGREAKSLKEQRKEQGLDKRERGMGGAVGKFGRGMISLSKQEIGRVQGMGQTPSSSSSRGRGGKRGGKR